MSKFIFTLSFLCVSVTCAFAQLVAFPGAEGFGKYAKGARASATPTVYHVTNLNDAGTGSFRDAVTGSNRFIVFDVAGVIKLTSGGIAAGANNYIAGQTAPGEGITVYGDRITFSSANNTICRYVRFRMGVIGTSGKDAMGIANGQDMIFDHISASWGRDETFSINWDSKGTEPTNITIQNSIIAQGLLLHSAGGLIQTNGGVTLYRNLYCDNSTRNNKVKGITEYVNNIVYNWDNAAYIMGGDSEGSSYVNVFSNYFIQGPNKGGTPISNGNSDYHIYGEDNWFDNTLDAKLNGYLIPHSEYSGGPDFQTAPYNYPVLPAIPASTLVNDLLPTVGASLPYRDYVDYYVVNEVKSFGLKGELLSTESTLPFGAPSTWSLWAGTSRVDTDKDGMPDDWENANGLNPSLASDAVVIAANGYTNIENYINSLTATSSQAYLRAPMLFGVKSSSQNSITFKWLDYTRDETGFVLERNINKVWTPIATIPAETDSFRLEGLVPEEKDTFRIKAINTSLSSDYSAQLIAKSKPIEVPVLNLATFTPDLTWNGATNSDWDKATANWSNGTTSVAFTDSAKVMLNPISPKTINLTDQVGIKALVVQSDSNVVLSGTGKLAGVGSVNKTGAGNLSLLTSNTYTGATVVHNGTLTINSLANGGVASSIGASANYAFNFVLKGGKVDYTGATVTTDRNILLDKTSELSVSNSAATVTMGGTLTGTGGFVKSGAGILKLVNGKGNVYEGETSIAGGTVNLDMNQALNVTDVLGTSNVVNLVGGTLATTNGQTANYEVYNFSLVIPEGKTGGFAPFRNCYIKSTVIGSGTLNYTIPYLREYIQGDWTSFTGILNANGTNTTANGGSQLLLDNGVGIPYARINLTGNTKIIYWTTTGTLRLGGLSGVAGTFLGSASKQTDGTKMTWIVGGAGTDETFNGIINNDCSASGHYGVTYIEKEGTGYWRLNGANVYTGTTIIRGGALIVNGTQTGTGAVTVMQDGTLAGKGKIPGVTEVQSGGTISAGDAYATPTTQNIGTLTVGALTLQAGSKSDMEINRSNSQFDKIVSTGAIAFGGTLNLKIVGTLVAGDQFQLFSGTAYSGAFSQIVPATPGDGLVWNFANGLLKVDPVNGVESIESSKVKIYPNPVSSKAQISLDKVYDQVTVTVESISGSTLQTFNFSGLSQMSIDLSDLPKGLYIARVNSGRELISTSKIMKK